MVARGCPRSQCATLSLPALEAHSTAYLLARYTQIGASVVVRIGVYVLAALQGPGRWREGRSGRAGKGENKPEVEIDAGVLVWT